MNNSIAISVAVVFIAGFLHDYYSKHSDVATHSILSHLKSIDEKLTKMETKLDASWILKK